MQCSFSQLSTCMIITGTLFFIAKGASVKVAPFFTQEPSDIIVQKHHPVVLNCTVKGNPKPTVRWRRNGVHLSLAGDNRRSILPDGSLYFKSIVHTKSNRPDEGRYQCTASSQIRSQNYLVISRSAELKVAGMSSKVTIEPSTLRVRYGDMARLLCKVRHSLPKAQFKWTQKHKNGATVSILPSSKYTFIDHGVLQIRDVQWSDAGLYTCTAHNKVAMRTHTSTNMVLGVDADEGFRRLPSFIGTPVDTNTTKGGRVILECAATGSPKPVVEWYKDSQPLSYDDRVKLVGASNLEITQVTSSDEGVYMCKISSGNFKNSASAKLLVHYPPTFLKKPKNKNAHVDDHIQFTCSASGNPTPTITWVKNGYPMEPSDYIIITSTSLKVESILPSDTGIYQCIAKNHLAEVQASAELAIFDRGIPLPTPEQTTTLQPPTTIAPTTTPLPTTTTTPTTTQHPTTVKTTPGSAFPGPPENLQTRTISQTEVEVTWDPPKHTYDKIISYNIFYSHAKAGSSATGIATTSGDTRKVVIKNLSKDTKYTFRVFGKNSRGTGSISLPIDGWTASQFRPGVPLSLAAVAISSSQIRVQWSQPSVGSSTTEYKLEYKVVGQVNATMFSTVTKSKRKTIHKLKTYTKYKISVYSIDSAGKQSHPANTVVTTFGGVPKGKPNDVNARGERTGTALLVTWKPPRYDVINGRISKYKLEFKKTSQKVSSVDVQGDMLKHKLTNLDRNTVYEVRVAAGTRSGYGDFSQWVRANTSFTKCSESRSPGKPTDMKVSIPVKGYESVKVEWQPPVDASQWCVTGYVVEYGEGTPFHKKIKDIKASTRNYLINSGISAGREYVIKIVAINSLGSNGPNAQKVIKIPPAIHVKIKPVKQVRVTPLSSHAAKVTWVEYIERTLNLYHVFRALKKTVVYCGNTTQQSINCTGLEPYTYYTFIVKRYDEKTNATATNRTLEAKPTPPLDITGRLVEDNSSDLYLNWQIPDRVNGKILRYRIFYSKNLSLPIEFWTKQDINGTTMNARIKNLSRVAKYYFKMKVKNGAGWSGMSTTKMIPTYDTSGGGHTDNDGSNGKGNVGAHTGGGLKDKTLWIVIAAVAGVTLVAIIVISVVLCKKRSGDDSSLRKPPPTYKAAVIANGSVKKKHKEDKPPDLWINHSENMEMRPLCKANPPPDVTNIPRSSTEMKPLADHPIDQIKLDHERCSFRKGSQDIENDLPPPPPQLLDQEDDDIDTPSPIAIPGYSPYRPVVSYPRSAVPDDGTTQLSYPLTSTPRHVNAIPRSESFDNPREPDYNTPLLRSHSDDIDHAPSHQPPTPIYAVPKPKNKPRLSNEDARYNVPPPTFPKPGPADDIQLPPLGYSMPNGRRAPSDNYPRERTSADTKDVVADLDTQLAGLEGLMKDLNDITCNDYLT